MQLYVCVWEPVSDESKLLLAIFHTRKHEFPHTFLTLSYSLRWGEQCPLSDVILCVTWGLFHSNSL